VKTLDLDAFRAAARRAEFTAAEPFPHCVIDGFLRPEVAAAAAREFDRTTEGWTYLHHVNEKKRILGDVDRMGPVTRAVVGELQSVPFVRALETLTGLEELRPDPDLDGAGLAEMAPGGFLNVHRDFLAHTTRTRWSRQVNLLVFLNADWPPGYGGDLELWDAGVTRCVRSILPVMNRCVIFATGKTSFHGVPRGVHCPAGRARRSLALYYFRDEGVTRPLEPTYYMPTPDDPAARRALIRLDTWAVRVYSWLKRHTPIGDALASRILRRF
jgi:hypothetical protein